MKVYFHTFGCKANQYDTELVRQAFADHGAVAVDAATEADLAVVNSCTVTHVSEAKMRTFVRRLARANRQLETVVMGCAAARDEGVLARLPSVRAVVGGADPGAVLAAAGVERPRASAVLRRFQDSARAWLKIQDGCDEHCTFCATTLARGNNRSRAIAEIVAEARTLAEHHVELVLTGVHIGAYGKDRDAGYGMRDTNGGEPASLGQLLGLLVRAVPRVRFRLSSVEATEVDDRLAELMVGAPDRVAPHLHAPLQSGSERVLKRMGRHWYTAASYRARIAWLAARLPAFGLGADVMAGFPGETEADHHATVALIDALPFTYLHVFPFSERSGTAATRLSGVVPAAVTTARARELRALGEAKGAAYRERRRGAAADGVVTGHGGGRVEVLTEDYLTVYLPGHRWDGRARLPITVD